MFTKTQSLPSSCSPWLFTMSSVQKVHIIHIIGSRKWHIFLAKVRCLWAKRAIFDPDVLSRWRNLVAGVFGGRRQTFWGIFERNVKTREVHKVNQIFKGMEIPPFLMACIPVWRSSSLYKVEGKEPPKAQRVKFMWINVVTFYKYYLISYLPLFKYFPKPVNLGNKAICSLSSFIPFLSARSNSRAKMCYSFYGFILSLCSVWWKIYVIICKPFFLLQASKSC